MSLDTTRQAQHAVHQMSADFFYVGDDRQAHGPIPLGDLRQLHTVGTVRDDTPIAQAGSQNWTPYAQHPAITGQAPAGMAPPVPQPAPRGNNSGVGKVFLWLGIGCLAIVLLAGGGCAFMFYNIFSALDYYPRKKEIAEDATAVMKKNYPELLDRLGEPLEPGSATLTKLNFDTSGTHYKASFDVEGPKSSGRLHFDAWQYREGDPWEFKMLELDYDGRTYDLLKPGDPVPPAAEPEPAMADPPEADEPHETTEPAMEPSTEPAAES